jgi:hypothetical protein
MDVKPKKTRKPGGKLLLMAFFRILANQKRIIEGDELWDVTGWAKDTGKRIRECRAAGYVIQSHKDRLGLKPGQYWCDSVPPEGYKPEKQIPQKVAALVFLEGGGCCYYCSAMAGTIHKLTGRLVELQLGHIRAKSRGGEPTYDNLRVVCSVCNKGASNLGRTRDQWTDFLPQLRVQTRDVQRKSRQYLNTKFEHEDKILVAANEKKSCRACLTLSADMLCCSTK